ncbi:AMP-binding protein [Curvivirga aplysinae]|uniref:AMP-binding protein n=1 Tax=Curvivirga aplysinae TaxID=2529852 RepID=UPI0012BCD26C|nr:AMP-binding protein [Curvivirga aplysinae]
MSTLTPIARFFKQALQRYPDRIAVTEFRKNGDKSYTYEELEEEAASVSHFLKTQTGVDDKILLTVSPGFGFLSFLIGCFYADRLVAPCFEPGSKRTVNRFLSIVDGFAPDLIIADKANSIFGDVKISSLMVDQIRSSFKALPPLVEQSVSQDEDRPILVQFTSGSTSDPKGVLLSQKNILSNLNAINGHLKFTPEEQKTTVTWLPPYHDLGLFSHLLAGLAISGHLVILKPIDFIRNPKNWLKALSDYKADYTGAPDFAFRACVKRVVGRDLKGLDFSNLKAVGNAAEPISSETLYGFQRLLEPAGFKENAWTPAYGLAEATVLVSAMPMKQGLRIKSVDRNILRKENRIVFTKEKNAQYVVALGKPVADTALMICDQKTGQVLAERQVGEVRVKGSSVALGYYHNIEATQISFHDGILKTGDLGFIDDGYLYLTGRTKDLIIVNGENFHPQDIEQEIYAFLSMEKVIAVQGQEGDINLLLEQPRGSNDDDLDRFCQQFNQIVMSKIGLPLDRIIVVKSGGLPLTSSGKVQRQKALEMLEEGLLRVVYEYGKEKSEATHLNTEQFVHLLSDFIDATETNVDLTTSLQDLRFDSLAFLQLDLQLGKSYNLSMDLDELPETVADLYQRLVPINTAIRKFDDVVDVSVNETVPHVSSSWQSLHDDFNSFLKTSGLLYDSSEQIIQLAQKLSLYLSGSASRILEDAKSIHANQIQTGWYWYLPSIQEKLRYWQTHFCADYNHLKHVLTQLPSASILVLAHMHGWEWILENILLIAHEESSNVILLGDYREIEVLLRKGHNYRRREISDYLSQTILDVNDPQLSIKLLQAVQESKTIIALPDTILAKDQLHHRLNVDFLSAKMTLAAGILILAEEKKLPVYHLDYVFKSKELFIDLYQLHGSVIEMGVTYADRIAQHYRDWAQWSILPTDLIAGAGMSNEALRHESDFLDQYGVIKIRSGEYVYLSSLVTGRSVEIYYQDFELLMEKQLQAITTLSKSYPLIGSLFKLEQ